MNAYAGRHGSKRVSLMMSSGLLGFSQMVNRVSTLAVMALLVRGAGTEAVGYYGLATLLASLIAIGLSFGMPTYLTRQVPAGEVQPTQVARVHGLRLLLLAAAAAIAYPILATTAPSDIHFAFFLFFAASLCDQWNETAWVLVRGTPQAWKEPLANSLTSVLLVGACAADLWLLDGLTFADAAVLSVAAALLRSAAATALTLTGRRRETVPLRLAENVKKAFPYLASDLLGLIYFRGDILVLTMFVTAAQVGEYVSATGLINPAVQVASAMSVGALAYAAPRAFSGGGDASEPTTIYRFFRQAGLGASGLISLALPIAILVLFGGDGGSGRTILQLALILTLFLSLRFANFGLSAILLAQGGAPRRVFVLLASIAVSVSLNLLLVRFLGAFGSAWSALLTEFVVAVALLWASRVRALIRPVAVALASTALLALATMASLKTLGPRPAAIVVGLCYLGAAAGLLIERRRATRATAATAIPVHTEEVV